MNQLIPITQTSINDELVQTVNARELHEFLEVGRMFAHWIRERIEKYEFQQDVDFIQLAKIGNTVEYHITLDMAKELAMVERNQKGKEARKYFIECERKALTQALQPPQNYIEALQALLVSEQEKARISQERDEALATKHHISDKKAASAMGKLGAAVKKHNNFKDDRGCGNTHATINEVRKATDVKHSWQPLKKWCDENDVEPREVYLTSTTSTYAYPNLAWFEVYGISLNHVFGEV